jgi:hypothetical protein
MERDACLVVLNLLGMRVGQSREPAHLHSLLACFLLPGIDVTNTFCGVGGYCGNE